MGGRGRGSVTTRGDRTAAAGGGERDARALAPRTGEAREVRRVVGERASVVAARPPAAERRMFSPDGAPLAGAAVGVVGAAATAYMMRARSAPQTSEQIVFDRYAKLIVTEYDIPIVPDAFEGDVYRAVCKAAYESAIENLQENLANANVLGHPVIMDNMLLASHVPSKSGISQQDLKAFIDSAVGDTSGIPLLLPGSIERSLYTNAVITGWTVFEDTLKSFRMQLFNRLFVFDITDADEADKAAANRGKLMKQRKSASGRILDVMPRLDSETLRRIAREELDAPSVTNVFPNLQENITKVAVGMLSQAITMEMNIKGFALEFALEPYSEDTAAAFQNISFSEEDRMETQRSLEELFEVLVDEYMDTRAMAISSMFLPREIERSTYINLLRGLFGELGKEPVMKNLGFNVAMRVTRRRDGPSAPELSYDEDSVITEELADGYHPANSIDETMGMLMRMGDELVHGDLKGFTTDAKQLMSGNVRDDATPAKLAAKAERRRMQKATRAAIADFVDYMLKDPMYNVKAVPDNIERLLYINCFELIVDVMTTGLSDFELIMLGRKIRMYVKEAPHKDVKSIVRFRPDVRALDQYTKSFEDLPAVQEIMSNVYAFVLAFIAAVASDFELIIVGHKIKTALSTDADAMFMNAAGSAVTDSLNDSLVAAIDAFSMDLLQVSSTKNLNANASSGHADAQEIDFDKEVFALFEKYSSRPDQYFPFPYLNQQQFAKTIDALIAKLLPRLTKWDTREATVAKISQAADLNGDGVIQWAEWYYAAQALNKAVLTAAKAKSGSAN